MSPVVQQQRHLSQALRESAVFGDLEPSLLHDLEGAMTLATVAGGDYVMREGEPSDSLAVVVNGRLRARRTVAGEVHNLREIGPGESAGEVGLVLRQPRSADVLAVRDSTVALLDLEGFEQLLGRHPIALNRAVARIIFQYAQGRTPPVRHTARTLALVPLQPGPAAGRLARRLHRTLARSGPAHLLTAEEGRTLYSGDGAAAIGRLSELEHRYDYLIYEGEAEPTPWGRRVVRQADQVLLVAEAGGDPGVQPIERALAEEPGYVLVRKSLVLLHPADAARPGPFRGWHEVRELERVYPLRDDHEGDLARLARFLAGRAVGLVLGGGGARGFAHLGVLRALAEAGVPVDAIGGNSMGALIAAQIACDREPREIIEQTRHFALGGARPALPLISLFSGQLIARNLQRMFGDTAIEGLWRPFYAVSCNLSRARMELHDRGPLWRAVLASNSAAGLLPPAIERGDLLVDGAVLDNVPVAPMRDKLGSGTVIAIDVELREEFAVDPALTRLSGWQALRQRLGHADDLRRLPGIVDIITRAGLVGGLSRQQQAMELADHYLQPPVSGFSKIGYHQAEEIAEAGYRYARERIATWREGVEW